MIHFQRPGSIIAFYQQIGRAGRSLDTAHAVLLEGVEDGEISEYFINAAFPSDECFAHVLAALAEGPAALPAVVARTNQPSGRVEHALKLLEVEEVVRRDGRSYVQCGKEWSPDALRSQRITAQRMAELEQMRAYVRHEGCRMELVAKALDDPLARPCGRSIGAVRSRRRHFRGASCSWRSASSAASIPASSRARCTRP